MDMTLDGLDISLPEKMKAARQPQKQRMSKKEIANKDKQRQEMLKDEEEEKEHSYASNAQGFSSGTHPSTQGNSQLNNK